MNKDIDVSRVILRTAGLIIHPWRQTDLDDLFAYASVVDVGRMAGWNPHRSIEESADVLRRFIADKKTFAPEYNKKVIGSLGIEKYNELKFPEFSDLACRELGFVLAKDYWGKSLMPEAVRAVCRYLFEEVQLDLILCEHFKWNKQSARVQQKCGLNSIKKSTILLKAVIRK